MLPPRGSNRVGRVIWMSTRECILLNGRLSKKLRTLRTRAGAARCKCPQSHGGCERSRREQRDRLRSAWRGRSIAAVDRPSLLAIALFACLAGCGSSSKAFDEKCRQDDECSSHLCVGGVHGEEPVCTKTRARRSCSGLTADNVLVCTHGSATPF